MTPAPDTLAVILAPQPVLLQYPPASFWQSPLVAGAIGALIAGVLGLFSPFVANWRTDRSRSQHVARRMRKNLQDMRTAVASVGSRLNPTTGLLEHFGPTMLDDLAGDLDRQLRAFRKRDYNTIYLRDDAVEGQVLAAVKALEVYAGILRRLAAPQPSPRDDIRITDYSQPMAEIVRRRCEVEVNRLDAVIGALHSIERWRWKLS